MVSVHPVFGQRLAGHSLTLGDFVGVMDRYVINAAGVDIYGIAKVFMDHGRALDMPTGEPFAPGAIPFHVALVVLWRELPKREIRGLAFLRIMVYAGSRLLFV